MAFASTASHTLTSGNVITEALELVGALAEGESPSTAAKTSIRRTLNNLIKLWSADTQIFAQGEYTLDLVASQSEYSLGVDNVGYIPNRILNATLIDTTTNSEIPLVPLTQGEWYALGNKTSESAPTQYYQKRNAGGIELTLNLWPVPSDTTYDVNLWLQYPYRDVISDSDDVYFTQEWYMALSFALAYAISFKYGVHPIERREIKEAAEEYYELAASYDTDGSVYLQPMTGAGS